MNKFEEELKKGNFITSECHECNKIVWPPSDYCDNCFSNVNWRKISENGEIIEWSKKGSDVFCISEFEKTIRIMGKLNTKNTDAKIGQHIQLSECTFNQGYRFIFT